MATYQLGAYVGYTNLRGNAERHEDKSVRVGTHIPVMEDLLKQFDVRFIFEHGMGLASTKFFHELPNVEKIISIENDLDWQKCESCEKDSKIHRIIQNPGLGDIESLMREDFDDLSKTLALVDGWVAERVQMVEMCIRMGVPFIVEHDAETFNEHEINQRKTVCSHFRYDCYQYVASNPESVCYVRSSMNFVPGDGYVRL